MENETFNTLKNQGYHLEHNYGHTLKGRSWQEKSGINSKNISMLENDKVDIGKKRTERLAKAFGVHPAVIMFPEYESDLMQQVA